MVVANADGTGEKRIATRKVAEAFSSGGPSWSPDGKLIASGVINRDPSTGGANSTVVVVEVDGDDQHAFVAFSGLAEEEREKEFE